MVEAVGNEVAKLVRIRFGPLALGELPEESAPAPPARGEAALERCSP